MIFLSLLAKTYALALAHLHPRLALLCWLAGAGVDVWLARKAEGGMKWGGVVLLQVAALVIGLTVVGMCDYAAMRWKDGIPVFAGLIGGVLSLLGMSVGSDGGLIYLTTMAGPLEFAASIDGMGLKVPVLMLALGGVWLLWARTPLPESLRKWTLLAGILLLVALLRTACVVLLADSLFDFVGYESEELPYRPFMDEAAGIWVYLPFLLGVGIWIGRFVSLPRTAAMGAAGIPRVLRWAGVPLMLLLGIVTFWQPAGQLKQGKVVLSSYHAQWSRSDRPYDREWYGADSGYNYACMKRLFGKFYQVADAPGPLTAADLEGASLLVVYDPDRRFTKDELERVHEFVRGGGGLLVVGDHTNVFGSTSHLNELCDPFGFQFRDDVLFDLDEDFHQVIDAPLPASPFWHGTSFFKLRGPASIRPTSFWTRSVYQVGHSKAVRAIYSVNNFYPPPHDDPKMRFGNFCVAAAAHHGGGRVAAWADSTVFSNFEIFYPGRYEYLLNTVHWLNHEDSMLVAVGRRMAPLILLAGVALFLLLRREPRVWLVTLALLAGVGGAARFGCLWIEGRRAEFPRPVQASEWVVFSADAEDPGHHLRGFLSEEPYDQRYEVFIQWVLRTGAFSGFHVLGDERANGLYDSLRNSDASTVASALIIRKPEDLEQLDELAGTSRRTKDPLLLMFSATVPAEVAIQRLQQSGLVRNAELLAQVEAAWPAGEVVIDDGGRRVMVVAEAERFSDQSMGISEKVVPDDAQRLQFDRAFEVIDRLFGREPGVGGK